MYQNIFSTGFALILMLCINGVAFAEDDRQPDNNQKPISGSLLLPSSVSKEEDNKEEKCMTVCARWGEECTYINKGSGGVDRRCRRACKQLTEECF